MVVLFATYVVVKFRDTATLKIPFSLMVRGVFLTTHLKTGSNTLQACLRTSIQSELVNTTAHHRKLKTNLSFSSTLELSSSGTNK